MRFGRTRSDASGFSELWAFLKWPIMGWFAEGLILGQRMTQADIDLQYKAASFLNKFEWGRLQQCTQKCKRSPYIDRS